MERRQLVNTGVAPLVAAGAALFGVSWAPAAEAYVLLLRFAAIACVSLSLGMWLSLVLTTDASATKIKSDEAEALRAKLAELEARQKPRRITKELRGLMAQTLAGATARARVYHHEPSTHTAPFAADIVDALKRGGWTVEFNNLLGLGHRPPTGVGVYVQVPSELSLAQRGVLDAFAQASVSWDLIKAGDAWSDRDIEIVVCDPKP